MQWKNPDGSLTEGVVVEDGAGNRLGTAANPLNVIGGSGGGLTASAGAFAAGALVDGADTTQGMKSDPIATVASGSAGSWSVVSLLKQAITALAGWLNVNIGVGGAANSATNPFYLADAYQAPVSGTWTSATTAGVSGTGATVAVATAGYDGVLVSFVTTGTVSAGHLTFEAYDGAAWLPIKGYAAETYVSYQGYTLTTGLNNAVQVDCSGFTQFRVRLDTAIAGAGSVKVTLNASSAPLVPGCSVGLDPTQPLPAGTNVLGAVTQSGGPWSVSGTFWQTTQPVSLASLPALAAGSNTIGAISNTSFAATQSGTWNIGSITSLPALSAGSNNIGLVTPANNPVGAANIATAQATVGTSATSIVAARTGAVGTGRVAVTIENNGAQTVYLGGSGVTTATGMILLPGASMTLNTTAAVYGVSGAAGQAVSAMETY
jgi:hypothetical protein